MPRALGHVARSTGRPGERARWGSRSFGVVLAVALLATTLAVATGGPAGAQPQAVRLVSQSLVVRPGGELNLVLDPGSGAPDGTRLVVTVNGPLAPAREGLISALAGGITTPVVGTVSNRLNDLARDEAGRVELSIPTVVRQQDKRNTNIRLANVGLYAVRVDLRTSGGAVLSRFTTFLVRTDDTLSSQPPMPVGVVLPADSVPSLQPDGTTVIGDDARQRLRTLTDVIGRNAAIPLTVAVRPSLVAGLSASGIAADKELGQDLRDSIGRREVVAATNERVDPSAIVAAGLFDDLTAQLRLGEDALAEGLSPARPNRTTWIDEGTLDEASLARLRDLGVRQILVHEAGLVPSTDTPVTATADLPSGDAALALTVAAADDRLSKAMEAGSDPVLSAYRLLAELCALQLDTPKSKRGDRGAMLLPAANWTPDPAMLGTFLDGLRTTPLLRAVTIDEWFANVDTPVGEDGARSQRLLADTPAVDLSAHAKALEVTRYTQAVLSSMLVDPTTSQAEADALLATSLAADLDGNGRQAYLDEVNRRLDVLRNAIEPVPKRQITLAGRDTEIPLTLRSRVDFPVKVKVRLSSAKLTFPEGDQIVEVDGVEQLRVPVETRASGTFPMSVQVMAPIGDIAVAPESQLTVRVSALSGFGIVVIVGLLLVLATWWVHQVRTQRRRKRSAQAPPELAPPVAP